MAGRFRARAEGIRLFTVTPPLEGGTRRQCRRAPAGEVAALRKVFRFSLGAVPGPRILVPSQQVGNQSTCKAPSKEYWA